MGKSLGRSVYSGEDFNSAFKGKGKQCAINLVKRYPQLVEVFSKRGDSWNMDRDIYNVLANFIKNNIKTRMFVCNKL